MPGFSEKDAIECKRDALPKLREAMRAARLAFPKRPIEAPSPFLDELSAPGVIASYLPMAGEADPALLEAAALARGWRLALPHVRGRRWPMRFLRWQPGDALEDGPFGLRQPAADAAEEAPDLVLTPLVAFDAALNRLGQGAGYYDRAFAALPAARRIGIAWSVQQVAALPAAPWDVPLHAVVTELGWMGEKRA
ncbi:5-formyltetrahydrofolate cyclo-ligase [Sphingomonas sp.]|uniref:5-formyltetrahydrofolate cyclo-ligase n=1 Tax=Sphingomonas sp. TaxID=28214 RepID=UPI0025E781E4|nr:5-formyltetrahydrofolate cyclo-ligase [Sphingomonas sp.]